MEQIDHALVDQLRDLGCDIDATTKKIQDLSNEQVMEYALDCIHRIDPNKYSTMTKIKHGTNINMALKFRLASNLAALCNSIGYKVKLEYQTFLYGNPTEIRNLFLFLVERACREDATELESIRRQNSRAHRNDSSVLKHRKRFCLNTKWLPPSLDDLTFTICHGDLLFNVEHILNFQSWQTRPIAYRLAHRCHLEDRIETKEKKARPVRPPVAPRRQTTTVDFKSAGVAHIISLCEWNQLYCLKNSQQEPNTSTRADEMIENYMRKSPIDNSHHDFNIDTVAQMVVSSEESQTLIIADHSNSEKNIAIDSSQAIADNTVKDDSERKTKIDLYIENKKSHIEQLTHKLDHLKLRHEELITNEKLLLDLEKGVNRTKKQYNELKTTSKPIELLKQDAISMKDDLAKYNTDWIEAKLLFEEEIVRLKSDISEINNSEKLQMKTKILDIQSDIEKYQLKIEDNYHTIARLNDKLVIFKEQEHGPSRSSYVKMLNEVLKQSKKQNDELNKILTEIRILQKEINTLSGRLQRSFILVDDAVSKGAKSDDWNRKCYKLLATMHEECDFLIKGVQDTGEVVREVRQLEEMVNLEKSKCINDSLLRVATDLRTIKDDNEKLTNLTQRHV